MESPDNVVYAAAAASALACFSAGGLKGLVYACGGAVLALAALRATGAL
ncbi:hypothetical protein ACTZWW_04170 [Salinarimonas sp. NSM]